MESAATASSVAGQAYIESYISLIQMFQFESISVHRDPASLERSVAVTGHSEAISSHYHR